MRKFIHKIQDLSKKAVELNQALQGLPGKAAEARQAIVMSAGELQQIRSDVQTSLNGLRATSENGLLQAMREINDATDIFEEAGYELTGMDLDLALAQRLSAQLQKFEDVPHTTLQTLLAQQTGETIKSVLSGIIKAEETAANIELTHLKLDGVIIHVGAIPIIRMCWRSDTFVEQVTAEPAQQFVSTVPSVSAAVPQSSAAYGSGSFFEQKAPSSAQTALPYAPSSAEAKPSAFTSSTHWDKKVVETSGAKVSALDRFKKMPDLSKRA